jgi:hypothetical protein
VTVGGLFGDKRRSAASWNLSYEKACVLFNIGHAYSELAVVQVLTIDEQMKAAMKYFQLSSGVFLALRDYGDVDVLSSDFDRHVLGSLSWLMLGQAAELVYIKSLAHGGRHVRSRLSHSCSMSLLR